MPKFKYQIEFEIKAQPRIIYSYLSTPSGLKDWFADKAKQIDENHFEIEWDKEIHVLKVVSKRTNAHIRFQFETKKNDDNSPNSYIDFKLDYNELTQTTFLRITDFSDMNDEEELFNLWTHLIGKLKETIGA
ncbi:MAG: START-like domain-containing protein [Flammeovirgaceae bacterium]|nr:START-like domain-containing protein [Flammeovirgaceae bacterium]MDW8287023.1 START-like domain-containing protein [Flammeovirgaceae bacterium]